jgi:hypothetical protein
MCKLRSYRHTKYHIPGYHGQTMAKQKLNTDSDLPSRCECECGQSKQIPEGTVGTKRISNITHLDSASQHVQSSIRTAIAPIHGGGPCST